MTAEAVSLFHGADLFPFQQEGIAEAYLRTMDGGGCLICWDTGTGKSIFAVRMAALLAEDARCGAAEHDLTIIACEKTKVAEWAEDIERFTDLSVRVHHGPKRMAELEKSGLPDVLITTYETGKADLVQMSKLRRGTHLGRGPLLEAIADRKVMVIFDEVVKLAKRSSANHKAWDYSLRTWRKSNPRLRVFGLTATPIERDWEDAYNLGRILAPQHMPSVAEFEATYMLGRTRFDAPIYRHEKMHEFAAHMAPLIIRKRKSDPDVREQFPKQVEESKHLVMGAEQAKLYSLVEDLQIGFEEPVPGLWTILRQIAAMPASLVRNSENPEGSALAKILVEMLGAEYLKGVPSVKTQALIDYLRPLVLGQGAKCVVFTFFGQSVLPLLAECLREAGLRVYEHHGGLSATEMGEVQKAFRNDPEPAVFLTSDAGARGINLPEASYVVEYESALTFANRTQRLNRIHRINTQHDSVTAMTFILDGTVEVKILEAMAERNTQTDILLGDTDAGEDSAFMTAAARREALQMSRLSRRRR